MLRTLCTLALLLLAVLTSVSQTLKRVPQDYATIQGAIDAAVNGDTVLVAEGTYSVNLILNKKIVFGSTFILDGDTSHISNTVLDGGTPRNPDSASVILIGEATDTTTQVIGFTIRNGAGMKGVWGGIAYVLGGGIAVIGGGAAILHNRIIDNHCTSAFIWCGASGIDIEFNQAMTVPPKPWVIADNLIADNISTTTLATGGCDGGGIAVTGQGRISNNTIVGNAAIGALYGGGGGLLIYGSPVTQSIVVSGNLFRSNSARNVPDPTAALTSALGGAIGAWANTINGVNYLPVVTLSNNLIIDNLHASALLVRSGTYSLINNTIAGNRGGSGIRLFDNRGPLTFRLLNNIVWNPLVTAGELYNGELATGSYNLIRGGLIGTDNISSDPGFAPGDTLYRLAPGSPALGAGVLSATIAGGSLIASATDYFGAPRPQPDTTRPDLGAIEHYLWDPLVRVNLPTASLPTDFGLEQNCPNPFNPSTEIRYQMSELRHVRLTVFDFLGREVAVLVDEEKPAGYHAVRWDASRMPSGIYFYRISVRSASGQRFQETNRMVLLK